MQRWLFTSGVLIGIAGAARADAPAKDPVLVALEHRNAAADAELAAQAKSATEVMKAKADESGRALVLRQQGDRQAADDFADADRRSHRHASIKTGLVLGAIGVACLAGGLASWTDASSREDAIATGGSFGTGHDISDAEQMIQIEQGTSYGAWSVGGVLTLTAIGFLW